MVGFNIVKALRDVSSRVLPVASATFVAGDLIELTAGSANWAKCTSSSNYFSRKAIVHSGGTTVTSVLAQELDGTELVVAAAANNSSTTYNGNRMLLTDENTVNNVGSDSDNTSQNVCFVQTGVVGAASDKLILGYVIVVHSVDPDAT